MRTTENSLSLMPKDLPARCPGCGTDFRLRRNVTVVPGRLRRISEAGANVSLWTGVIFWILIVLLHCLSIGESIPIFRSLGFGTMALLLGPYLLFEMLTSISPKTRLLACHRCGFAKTFHFPPPRR